MASVRIEKLCKTFDEKTNVVDDVSVCIRDNEFVVIVGPSGCGKTTTLNIIAGLEKPSSGHIFIDDECVDDVEPKDRNIAMVFQTHSDQKSSNDDISSASQSDQNIVNSNLYTTGLGSVSKR